MNPIVNSLVNYLASSRVQYVVGSLENPFVNSLVNSLLRLL